MDTPKIYALEGRSEELILRAQASKPIPELVGIKVVLPPDFSEAREVSPEGTAKYQVSLKISPTAAVGKRSGNITVWLCQDSVRTCNNPYPGSPWTIPYQIDVSSKSISFKPLAALQNAPAWTQYRGNSARTGYVPTTSPLNPDQFSLRWESSKGIAAIAMNGLVYTYSSVVTPAGNNKLTALNENDGSTAWEINAGFPTSAQGKIISYIPGEEAFKGQVRAIDPKTGILTTQYSDQGYDIDGIHGSTLTSNGALLADGDSLYVAGFTSDFVFSVATGKIQWKKLTSTSETSSSASIPSIGGNKIYLANDQYLKAKNIADGSELAISANSPNAGSSQKFSAIPVGPDQVIASHFSYGWATLSSYSIIQNQKTWTVKSNFLSTPAIAEGIIYVVNIPGSDYSTPVLEARSTGTGDLLWSTALPNSGFLPMTGHAHPYNLVVVGNWVFVSPISDIGAATYAINRSTHSIGWQYPVIGTLAVSENGILYVARNNGTLFAFNLH
ncbi:PQQ-binding-like beta-propeller repeat protein [Acidovorax sp. NCPPB 2350]|nr:PQQ-binding-like beta-propeller repeat protein [Acidovorax sp. NCPPB 2350]